MTSLLSCASFPTLYTLMGVCSVSGSRERREWSEKLVQLWPHGYSRQGGRFDDSLDLMGGVFVLGLEYIA